MIEVQGLQKSFPTALGPLRVLKGLDFTVRDGEMLAIAGASGVGKSTLLHILGAIDRPSGGKVLYDGLDIFSLPEAELDAFRNRRVGFVFQFHFLLPEFSALENVMMPGLLAGLRRAELSERAKELLSELGLAHRLRHRPGELSGGEQQRVAVARALLMNPQVVLADEPTGNLDTATGSQLLALLRRLNETRGSTFVIATHDERIWQGCHRVLRLQDGQVVEEFSP
jgi:lipoprotein-releasing system ATP-binding protein